MIYGNYKIVRNAAWQVLIDYGIKSLPVSALEIANAAGIKVIKNKDVNMLHRGEAGASITDGKDWYIVYDEKDMRQRVRFTIAHELGHIFLGHAIAAGYHARTIDVEKPEVETQADVFAGRLLAPAVVLWGVGVHTAFEISALCDISSSAAKIRAERMEILYTRNKFLASPLEREVYEHFLDFIENCKDK
ncbi:MAG: ImmA/IrrE family metallo-endopeptidase [Oscillospiraceae bacterium]